MRFGSNSTVPMASVSVDVCLSCDCTFCALLPLHNYCLFYTNLSFNVCSIDLDFKLCSDSDGGVVFVFLF
jgi:hypothetical protein